ncbi:hypothetical protein HOY80DRAFT_1112657, partial [Tuber brumale]
PALTEQPLTTDRAAKTSTPPQNIPSCPIPPNRRDSTPPPTGLLPKMHQGLFLLLPAFHLASGFVVPDGVLHPNASTVTTIAYHSQAAKATEKIMQQNEPSAPNHNIRMFLIIFGAISGFLCLSVALFFARAHLTKKRHYSSGKKKRRAGRITLSRLPRDRRSSTESDIWGLTNDQQGLGTAGMQEKDFGSLREEVIRPHGYVYQEVPTEEAGRRYTSDPYHPSQYPGPNPRVLEERDALYEGPESIRDSRASVRSMGGHSKPTLPTNVI